MAKCGRKGCEKEVPDGRWYHSKACAQVDVDSDEESGSISADQTGTSSAEEDGEASPKSLPEESQSQPSIGSEASRTTPEEESERNNTTMPTESSDLSSRSSSDPYGAQNDEKKIQKSALSDDEETESERGSAGMSGGRQIEKSRTRRNTSADTIVIPADGSNELQQSLHEARLVTMNTIDESATLLLDCMRSAAKRGSNQEAPRDFRDLNAIANLGKQIAQLAKVKLDAIKEARK
jgi:hypothetical protein